MGINAERNCSESFRIGTKSRNLSSFSIGRVERVKKEILKLLKGFLLEFECTFGFGSKCFE